MNDEPSEPLGIDYPRQVHEALRDVVRRALGQAAEEGLPGEHHFVLSFKTRHPGVRLPRFLLDLHPEEMAVVLEHQFWDLFVDAEAFSVTLAFGGSRQSITVPFAALTAFADPSVPFGLRFEAPEEAPEEGPEETEPAAERGPGPAAVPEPAAAPGEDAEPAADTRPGGDGRVVCFDRFRKKE